MNLINAFVHNPVKVAVGVLLVMLFGIVALWRMPMQLTPEVQTPTITIETRWPGASPQEVEREIIMEQEEQLKGVEGVTKLSSESMDSQGRITLEFLVGTNMDEALLKVNSRLQQVREYPEDADLPVISTANVADRPIAWFILSAKFPAEEEFARFEAKHPQLKEQMGTVRGMANTGVAMYRLRSLARQHPEFQELLPPPSLDVSKLRRFAEDEIESRFERVAGVSQANVMGGLQDELQIIVDPEKLSARQLTLSGVSRVLRAQNEDISAGDLWEGKRSWDVRTLSRFRDPAQVENQLLTVVDGAPVYVRDVAEVRLGYKKPDGLVRRFGESNISVNCIRETNANVLDVMAGLRQAVQELNEGLLFRRGLQLTQVYDETEYIYSSIGLVRDNIFIGTALTISVLMCFLHLGTRTILWIPLIVATSVAAVYLSSWFFAACLLLIVISGFWFARGSLVVALAIPTSIVGTFLTMGLFGRSLNVISLAGLAFAVGMLVDNAVVVLENIYRRNSLGEDPFTASIKGAQEVWGAVVASTLTTVAVFVPVVFVQEEAGQLFRDIALAIAAAVALSMIVSIVVVPPSAARLLHRRREDFAPDGSNAGPHGSNGQFHGTDVYATPPNPALASGNLTELESPRVQWIARLIERLAHGFVDLVVDFNTWSHRGILRRLAVVGALTGAAVLLTLLFWPRVEYLPSGNRNLVFGMLLPPPGYNLDELTHLGEMVEAKLRPYWDVDPDSPEAKKLKYPVIEDLFFVARGRQVFMGLRSHDPLRTAELVPLVREVTTDLPGTFAVARQSSLFERGPGSGRSVDVEITGPELTKLVSLGGQVLRKVTEVLPNAQARPVPSLDLSSPELHVEPKLVQAAEMGVSGVDLGFTVNALIDGAYSGDYFHQGKKIDLTITGKNQLAKNSQDLSALPIATPLGQLIPLESVADVRLASGPEQVNHRERVRSITIEVAPPAEVAIEDALIRIRDEIVRPLRESGELDGGYSIALAGTADKLRETWNALKFNVLLALLITYLLMAALFESWLYPFVIILSVPLGAVGGVLALQVLNLFVLQPLDVLTMLGFVILVGTVVNNPILIVHQALNHMREDGMAMRSALLESVRNRIRPIFMTTITTVLGLLPLVLFPGAGSELYRGLGAVVLGGLALSTVFTLILVPALFSLSMEAKAWFISRLAAFGLARPAPHRQGESRELSSPEVVSAG